MNKPILIVAGILVVGSWAAGASQQRPDYGPVPYDSFIQGRRVLPFAEFEQAVQNAAAESGLSSAIAALTLHDFKNENSRRVIYPNEWRPLLLETFYRNEVPYPVARRFFERLNRNVRVPVDTGFLEGVHTVDLSDRVVHKIGKEVTAPIPIVQPLPLYTEAARSAGVEGLVIIRCVVLENGSVANCTLVRGIGHGLDESVVQTIQDRWKFQPGRREGKPVPVEANIEVSMRLY